MKLGLAASICFLLGFSLQASAYGEAISMPQQQKYYHIIIRLNKYEDAQLTALMHSLSSHQGKIPEYYFNSETRQLTIYYTSSIMLDDIFQLVLEHITDFDKVSGTEI